MTAYLMPTRSQIDALKVGDEAPNAFGRMAKVVRITARQDDRNGMRFVCYMVETSPTSSMSMSMKENELVRHAGLRETSAELDRIECEMRAGRAMLDEVLR